MVPNYKEAHTKFVMFTEGKVTEIFYMVDEFCKFFNRMMEKHAINDDLRVQRRKYHRDSTLSDAEVIVVMIKTPSLH